jgi:hypothetical protein
MIYLGSAGVCIGFLGLLLFRGFHHDHNIGDEIVEQKKNDFVQSVYDTLRNLDVNRSTHEQNFIEQNDVLIKPEEVVINETSSTIDEQSKQGDDLVLTSLNDTCTNAFITTDTTQPESPDVTEQQLRVPTGLNRIRSKSGESMVYSTLILNTDKSELDNDFQESTVYATLHALCLHSLVNID